MIPETISNSMKCYEEKEKDSRPLLQLFTRLGLISTTFIELTSSSRQIISSGEIYCYRKEKLTVSGLKRYKPENYGRTK